MLKINDGAKKAQRIVLIGGNGFIGKNVAEVLGQNNLPFVSWSSKEIDLTQESCVPLLNQRLQDGDAVVFLSCITPDKGKDETALLKNVKMACHFAAIDPQKELHSLVYISSDAVFNLEQSPISEETIPAPTDLYGAMHLSREIIFKEFSQRRKIPLCIVRPVAVFGAGDTHNSYGPNRFMRMLEKDNKITLFGSGADKRDHIFVQDLAQIIHLCLAGQASGVINVASGRSLSFLEVAQELKKALKKNEAPIDFIPNNSTPSNKYFDNSNLVKAFPFFRFTDFAQALHRAGAPRPPK